MNFSNKVIEHFMCPQNLYSMPDADVKSSYSESVCGDSLTIFIKVKNNIIDEISYLVYGCSAAIATSSMVSVLAKGKTLEEAMAITEQDIVDALEGLPEEKMHCSLLGIKALRKTINKYKRIYEIENKEVSK